MAKAPSATNGINRLAEILGLSESNGQYQYRYEGRLIPLDAINVLPQPRRTFEDIELLAIDIADKGILNPLTIAEFNPESATRYLTAINALWGTSFSIINLKLGKKGNGRKRYHVLLAGERRFRSCLHLWERGCAKCQETHGTEPPGTCFRRHFGEEGVRASICVNIPPLSALFLQLSENTHMRVPPEEEAEVYSMLFHLVRRADPKFSMARFAESVGRSPSAIRNALLFTELPESIRGRVGSSNNRIPYGIAIELARLQREGVSEEDLTLWALRSIAQDSKVEDFHESVTRFIANRNSGQASLLEIMDAESERVLAYTLVRQVVERKSILALWAWVHYVRRVITLFEDGQLGQEDSPFSKRSPLRLLRNLSLLMRDNLIPHLKSAAPHSSWVDEAKNTLDEAIRVSESLGAEGEPLLTEDIPTLGGSS